MKITTDEAATSLQYSAENPVTIIGRPPRKWIKFEKPICWQREAGSIIPKNRAAINQNLSDLLPTDAAFIKMQPYRLLI